jgi:hypothetical protein
LAVNAGAVAIPLAFVMAVALVDPLNEALAPVVGAVNVTVTPLRGVFPFSAVACNAVVNRVLIVALWGVPPVAMRLGPTTESAAPFKLT